MHKPPFFKVIVSLVTAVTLFVQTVPGLTLIGEKTANEILASSHNITSTPSPTEVSESQLVTSAPESNVTSEPSIPLQSTIPTASSDKTEDVPTPSQSTEEEAPLLGV